MQTLEERFNNAYIIDSKTECWNWVGGKFASGYGIIKLNSRRVRLIEYLLCYF